ncbi:hypothetical protein [Orientia tsutsugamushi]|uniref:hypothetical protein n=1 Tax=Orientia tsutsugamushi TaxID=784 RepID=UPI003526D427
MFNKAIETIILSIMVTIAELIKLLIGNDNANFLSRILNRFVLQNSDMVIAADEPINKILMLYQFKARLPNTHSIAILSVLAV